MNAFFSRPFHPARFATLLIFLTAIAIPAHADRFAYAFKLDGGISEASGTFVGTLNGNLIENPTDVTLYLDGVQVTGAIQTASFSPSFQVVPGSVVSFDVYLNNFLFANSDPWTPAPDAQFLWIAWSQSVAGWLTGGPLGHNDFVTPEEWSLTKLPDAVPDSGSTIALGGLALGLLVLVRRPVRSS